jgi:uncharacterized protein YndB with AHSA1/START domain
MSETVAIEPIVKSVHVSCTPEHAFSVFTRGVGAWWPLETHAIHAGAVREVVWEERAGGEVYEISNDGAKAHWATVLAWEPHTRVVIAWHVNPEAAAPTEMDVSFLAEGDGTRVQIEHRHWERLGDAGIAMRENYQEGWDHVLGCFAAHVE